MHRAGAAILAAVVLLGEGCSSSHASPGGSPPVSTTVAASSSTTEAPPQYAPSPYSWVRSASPALAVGGGAGTTLAAVISPTVGQDWFAAGTRVSAGGVPTATAWTSPDGVNWRSSAVDAGGTPSSALAAAQYRGETVVVGSVGAGANRQAAAWLSPKPGEPFTAVTVPVSSGPSSMSLVAVGALGLFATGTVDGRFALWSSTDGRRWGELPAAEKTITATTGARVTALMAEGATVYAAGSVGRGANQAAAVWTSTDGIHWHAVTTATNQFAGPGQRVIYSLAPLQNGLVAVGALNRGTGWVPTSWVSPDGASWSPPSTDFPGAPTPGAGPAGSSSGSAARSVSAVPTFAGSTSLVAAGGGPSGQGAWKSTDGLHWDPIGLPAPDADASGWRATIAAATIDATVIADGEPGQAHLLTDTTSGWKEPSADPKMFGPVRPFALPVSLQPSGDQLVLTVRLRSAPQAIGNAAVTYTTLESPDGAAWNAAGAATAGPATVPTTGAVTLKLPGEWLAVGEPAPGQPEAWISPDGRSWTPEGLLGSAGAPAGSGPGASSPGAPSTAAPGTGLAATVGGLCTTTPSAATPPAGTPSTATPSDTAPASGNAATPAGSSEADTVAAVGSALQPPAPVSSPAPAQGHQAAAWYWKGQGGWKRASVSPAAPAGALETMSGCVRTANGLVAWGTSTAPGGGSAPALWRSTTGAAWNRVNVSAFTSSAPSPLTDLAADGSDWLAVADPNPAAGPSPVPPPAGPVPGPAAAAASSEGTGPGATFENGQNAMWLSADGGSSWQALDTAAPPWLGTDSAQADLVGFAGSAPVLAGSVDGQLAVWTGTAAPAGSATASRSPSSSG